MNRIASTGPNSLTRISTPFFIAAVKETAFKIISKKGP